MGMARKGARHSAASRPAALENAEIKALEQRLVYEGPGGDSTDASFMNVRSFDELPLSQRTKTGLKEHKFTRLTAIQRSALPYTLCGKDVLGAAKTGSGKTLSFLLPVCSVPVSPLPLSVPHFSLSLSPLPSLLFSHTQFCASCVRACLHACVCTRACACVCACA